MSDTKVPEGISKIFQADFIRAKTIDQTRLLVVGMGGLGAAVVRDAVKSGFTSVTMMDHKDWTDGDRPAQFLIRPEDVVPGNRAEASLLRAQTLNHKVAVYVETRQVSELTEKFFQDRFDVVVASCTEVDDILRLNSFCRKTKVKFFAANVFGLFGFIFSDLQNHCYTAGVRGIISPYAEKTVRRCKRFVPFEKLMNNSCNATSVSPWYFVLKGLMKFTPHQPTSEDFPRVKDLIAEESPKAIPESTVRLALEREVPLICRTIGEVLHQEIVKAVTRKEEPIDNVYIFDPIDRKGKILRID